MIAQSPPANNIIIPSDNSSTAGVAKTSGIGIKAFRPYTSIAYQRNATELNHIGEEHNYYGVTQFVWSLHDIYTWIHTWTTSLSEVQLVLLPKLTMFLTTAKIVFLQNIFPLMAQKGHQATERLMIVRKTMSYGTHSFSVGLLH